MFSSRLFSLGRQLLNTNVLQSNQKFASFNSSTRNICDDTNLTFMHNISFPDLASTRFKTTHDTNSMFVTKIWRTMEFLRQPTVDEKICNDVIANVNEKLAENAEGRLFAVVQLCGKQFKVTAGDILIVEGYWPPSIGDQLKLEKVNGRSACVCSQ